MNNQKYGSASLSCAERTYGKVVDLTKLNRDTAWRIRVAAQQRALSEKLSKDTLTLNSCPICHNSEFELFVEIYGFPYCECSHCGHIFSQKPPSAQAVKRLYTRSGKENQSIQSQLYVNKELFATRVMEIAAPKVHYVTTRMPNRGKWVDIGCGTGEILCAAKAQGWDVLGIESDPDEVEFARTMGIEVEQLFIEPENVRNYVKGAAVVSLINILEHVLTPERLLKAIADSINEETRIVIEVPRHPSLSSYANKTFPHVAVRHIYAPDHLHIFTEKAMDILFNRLGLVPKNIWLFGQDFYEIISSMASVIECQNMALYNEVLRAVCSTQEAIDKLDLADTAIVILMKS
jgi:SAM-dependent methyltransferase